MPEAQPPRPPVRGSPRAAADRPEAAGPTPRAAARPLGLRHLSIGAVVAALLGALLLLPSIAGLTQGVGDSELFLLLNAVTVVIIFLLGSLLARSFWRMLDERRRGIVGSHLDLKFAAAFVLIVVVTASGLFVMSAFFLAQSIDKWLDLRVDTALQQGEEVAESVYETAARTALSQGERMAARIAADGLLRDRDALVRFVGAVQRDHDFGLIEVFPSDGGDPVTSVNPEIPATNFSHRDGDPVQRGLSGESSWRAQEVANGEVLQAVVPIPAAGGDGDGVAGALVVNAFLPLAQVRRIANIRATLDAYRTLEPTAGHLRSAYLLELGFAFVAILMLATWMGLRLARGVTGAIRELAEGTAEVASGNLDIVVERTSDDEIGFLVQSFNRMTHDLRIARSGVERGNAELERRRRYVETVVGSIGAGVLSLDADAQIQSINPSARRYLGIQADDAVLGEKLASVARQPALQATLEELADVLRPGLRDSARRSLRISVGDDVATLLVTLHVLYDESGAASGTVAVFDDHTQLAKVQRMEAWREVARRIAHEIKNPLTPIQLSAQRIRRRFGERLSRDPEDAAVLDECVDSISNHVRSLELLVDEFANFARLPTANPEPDDLNQIVTDAVASYHGTEGVEFETDLDADLPSVDLDREQMRRALSNLIDNAIAAARRAGAETPGRGGHVRLRTARGATRDRVRLEVADDGAGIPREDRRRIFEPYFSTKRKGTGLGLAIVSRIVADHRGYVRVQDEVPHGTRFVVELPVRGV